MRLHGVIGFAALLAGAGAAVAVGPRNTLNDTAVTTFADETVQALATEPATHPGQDARYGRDAAARVGALTKVGGGRAGFDFTKIANNGSVRPAGAALGTGPTDWACTYDNVTGLMWEVKVVDPTHFRYMAYVYSWFDSSITNNGGDAGWSSIGVCRTPGRCDTEKFVQDVNAAGLCGHNDWRMPRFQELRSIVDHSKVWPEVTVDADYFPNLDVYVPEIWPGPVLYWSGTAYAVFSGSAWPISLETGMANLLWPQKSNRYRVFVVREGP